MVLCLIILFCLPSRYTGRVVLDVINLGSYNYLGFAENTGPCADSAAEITMKYGVGVASTRQEIGTKTRHAPLPLLSLEPNCRICARIGSSFDIFYFHLTLAHYVLLSVRVSCNFVIVSQVTCIEKLQWSYVSMHGALRS